MSNMDFQAFLETHQLPASYLDHAFAHFKILIDDCLRRQQRSSPIVIGINGCQGSGKSTLAAFLQEVFEQQHHLKVVNISLDDFYLSKADRAEKARHIHPLLATRGVPGTHDIELAHQTLGALLAGKRPRISRFNKAEDDLLPKNKWDTAPEKVQLIILEGWCLGAQAQTEQQLARPVNVLEQEQDPKGIWRHYVNQQLKAGYRKLFDMVDCLVMLKAPAFDNVLQWRLEQENKLAKKLQKQAHENRDQPSSGLMSPQEIEYFIQFFQRITEHILEEMPERADHCYYLDSQRQITHERHYASVTTAGDTDIY